MAIKTSINVNPRCLLTKPPKNDLVLILLIAMSLLAQIKSPFFSLKEWASSAKNAKEDRPQRFAIAYAGPVFIINILLFGGSATHLPSGSRVWNFASHPFEWFANYRSSLHCFESYVVFSLSSRQPPTFKNTTLSRNVKESKSLNLGRVGIGIGCGPPSHKVVWPTREHRGHKGIKRAAFPRGGGEASAAPPRILPRRSHEDQ
jgi:hypothetical protein